METLDRILDLMELKGIKQIDLAKAIGINKSVVANWKKRNCNPPVEYLETIANLLDVSVNLLVCGTDNPQKYNLTNDEFYLVRLYRISDEKDRNAILKLAIALSDEKLCNTNGQKLLNTLIG